jgi:carbon-monoxide dehydrogenase medium subunit
MPVPRPFDYYAPTSIEEAIRLLAENKDEMKIIAGGQSLMPLMKFRLVSPKALVDIGKHLKERLSYVEVNRRWVSIGALTTHYTLSTSDLLRSRSPMLAKAAGDIGDYQVRNRGTIGGSICHADPAAHYPPAMIALSAELVAVGPDGKRVIRAASFFKDMFTTALAPDEILTEVKIPIRPRTRWGYEVIQGQGGSYATAIAAVLLDIEGSICSSASVVIGACTPVPVRANKAEDVLQGRELTRELLVEASSAARSQLREPLADARVRADYRRDMAALAVKRALFSACGDV